MQNPRQIHGIPSLVLTKVHTQNPRQIHSASRGSQEVLVTAARGTLLGKESSGQGLVK